VFFPENQRPVFTVINFKILKLGIFNNKYTQHNVINIYVVGSKSFKPEIKKPRQMENVVRDI
jgi:hypothetical protein